MNLESLTFRMKRFSALLCSSVIVVGGSSRALSFSHLRRPPRTLREGPGSTQPRARPAPRPRNAKGVGVRGPGRQPQDRRERARQPRRRALSQGGRSARQGRHRRGHRAAGSGDRSWIRSLPRPIATAAWPGVPRATRTRRSATWTGPSSLPPTVARSYFHRGFAYFQKDQFEKALADYSEAIRLDPKYAAALRDRGYVHVLSGDAEHGLADINAAHAAGAEGPGRLHQPRQGLDRDGRLGAGHRRLRQGNRAGSQGCGDLVRPQPRPDHVRRRGRGLVRRREGD